MVNRSTPRETGRPHSLALPGTHEFWMMLERFNKAALSRRFPDWVSEPATEVTGR